MPELSVWLDSSITALLGFFRWFAFHLTELLELSLWLGSYIAILLGFSWFLSKTSSGDDSEDDTDD